jgi:hypothetical protein
MARSRRTSTVLNLPILLVAFQPPAENENTGFFRRYALVLVPGKGRGGSARGTSVVEKPPAA